MELLIEQIRESFDIEKKLKICFLGLKKKLIFFFDTYMNKKLFLKINFKRF